MARDNYLTRKIIPQAQNQVGKVQESCKYSIDNSIIKWYYSKADKKHLKTLDAIFEKPIRSNIPWKDIEVLFVALGAEVTEGRGSRVRVELNSVRAVFHRPHPEKETDKGALKSVQRFLTEAGVINDGI